MRGIATSGSAQIDMTILRCGGFAQSQVRDKCASNTALLRRASGRPRRNDPSDVGLGLEDLATAILARLQVDVVRPPPLAGFLVLDIDGRRERVCRAAG